MDNNFTKEYDDYNKKMEIIYNILKFDYLVQVAVNELHKMNQVTETEPPAKRQRRK